MKQAILLVGLPGSGKSTVGRILAERLGAPFVDCDTVVQRRMNMPVARIFAEHGEPRFRQLEAEAVANALKAAPGVIAPGGGWAAQPGALEEVRGRCFLIYLKVSVLTAVKRVSGEATRPLLAGHDPNRRMKDLLQEREPFYVQAAAEVKVDNRTPQAIADELAQLARSKAGW